MHWVSLGHFYHDTYGHFGYSDSSNRIWFEATPPLLNNMFSSLSKQYSLQRCDVDFGGQQGGMFDVSEDKVHESWFCEFKKGCLANVYNITGQPASPSANIEGQVHNVANAIFGFDYLKNVTLGKRAVLQVAYPMVPGHCRPDGWLHRRPREATRLFG